MNFLRAKILLLTMACNISWAFLILILLSNLPSMVYSRAEVSPSWSKIGSLQKYVLRIPNERNVPTVRVELTFPAGLKVMSFQDVPGWKLTIHKDSAGLPLAAEWTGSLGVDRFVEFPFVATNPDAPTRLYWPTSQEYSGGELDHWTSMDTSQTSASSTEISSKPPIVEDTVKATSLKIAPEEDEDTFDCWSCYLIWISLALSLVALVVALFKCRALAQVKPN